MHKKYFSSKCRTTFSNSQFGHEESGGGRGRVPVAAAGVARHQQERRGGLLAAVGAAAGGVGARLRHVARGVACEWVVQAAAARLERVALLGRDRVAPAKTQIASPLICFNFVVNRFQRRKST